MHIPKRYANENVDEVLAFVRDNAFGQLVTVQGNNPFVTHIPIELERSGEWHVLRGHVSRANPQSNTFHGRALAIFTGPHAYISSSWYNHVNVPTWNYIAVHIQGEIRRMNDEELYASLITLTDKYEVASENPVSVQGMKDHVVHQMKGIIGFEMTVEKIEGKWKLSQNRDKEDFKNIILQLEKINRYNELEIAREMKKLNIY